MLGIQGWQQYDAIMGYVEVVHDQSQNVLEWIKQCSRLIASTSIENKWKKMFFLGLLHEKNDKQVLFL